MGRRRRRRLLVRQQQLGLLVGGASQLLGNAAGSSPDRRPLAGKRLRGEIIALGTWAGPVHATVRVSKQSGQRAQLRRCKRFRDMASFVPSIALLLCAAHVKSHHAPGQVGHALGVWQLRLCARVQLPDLGAQRIVLLQLRGRLGAGGIGVVAKGWENGLVEHAVRRQRRAAVSPHVKVHGGRGRRERAQQRAAGLSRAQQHKRGGPASSDDVVAGPARALCGRAHPT